MIHLSETCAFRNVSHDRLTEMMEQRQLIAEAAA